MDGLLSYVLSKKYTKDSLIGIGALKGAPAEVKSIEELSDGYKITLKWEDKNGVEHLDDFTLKNGEDGEQGPKGDTGISIVNITKTSTQGLVDTYTIKYSDNTSSTFQVTNGKDGELPEIINNRYLHTNTITGELEWSTVNSEESIDLDIGESNPSEYLWSKEYKTVRYSVPYGRGYDDYMPDIDNFGSRADYFTGVIYNLEDSCIIKGNVNHFENKIKYTYIGVVNTDGEIRWSCEYEDKNIKQYFSYEFPEATYKDTNKIAFDKSDNEFKICKAEPQNFLRYINSENDDICIVSLKDYNKVYLFNNNTYRITPTNYYIIMDSEDSFYYEDEDYNVHNFTSNNFIGSEQDSIYYWDSYNIGSGLPDPEADDKILISLDGEWVQSDKQDVLPTIVNDKYLHTNATTGKLEWSSVGDSVEIDDTTTSTDKVWSSSKVNADLTDKASLSEDNTFINTTQTFLGIDENPDESVTIDSMTVAVSGNIGHNQSHLYPGYLYTTSKGTGPDGEFWGATEYEAWGIHSNNRAEGINCDLIFPDADGVIATREYVEDYLNTNYEKISDALIDNLFN